jgi:hypothetical protein
MATWQMRPELIRAKLPTMMLLCAYERFLELPVAPVLAVLWLVGAAFLVSCALMVYLTGSVLLAELL